MDAVIPAAGRGSRLGELTADRPKGLVEVAERPLLAHVFETAVEAGAGELVVVIGYEAARIVDRFGDALEGVPITYIHQRERLGLGYAVLQAEPHVDGTFLLVNGDNALPGSVVPAMETVEEADAAFVVEEVSPEVATTTGVIETEGRGRVAGIIERPAEPSSTLVTTGCYVLPEDVFSRNSRSRRRSRPSAVSLYAYTAGRPISFVYHSISDVLAAAGNFGSLTPSATSTSSYRPMNGYR